MPDIKRQVSGGLPSFLSTLLSPLLLPLPLSDYPLLLFRLIPIFPWKGWVSMACCRYFSGSAMLRCTTNTFLLHTAD